MSKLLRKTVFKKESETGNRNGLGWGRKGATLSKVLNGNAPKNVSLSAMGLALSCGLSRDAGTWLLPLKAFLAMCVQEEVYRRIHRNCGNPHVF